MRKIEKPNDNPRDVYLKCIKGISDVDLKNKLTSVVDEIDNAANDYDQKAMEAKMYMIGEHDDVGGIISKDVMMGAVYNGLLTRVAGRPIYEKLKGASEICPLCGQRDVATLDHYLPQAKFPSLVVVPFNLVPACNVCNFKKSTQVAGNAENQTLHPYYDNITEDQWLYAEIDETTSTSVAFFVEAPVNWDNTLKKRVLHHFKTFELASLYRSQASTEFGNIRHQLILNYNRGGKDAVKTFLVDGEQSRTVMHINSWQRAMYQAMTKSEWFCDGGFL